MKLRPLLYVGALLVILGFGASGSRASQSRPLSTPERCLDLPCHPSHQGQLHHVLGGTVHLPLAGWAVLYEDQA